VNDACGLFGIDVWVVPQFDKAALAGLPRLAHISGRRNPSERIRMPRGEKNRAVVIGSNARKHDAQASTRKLGDLKLNTWYSNVHGRYVASGGTSYNHMPGHTLSGRGIALFSCLAFALLGPTQFAAATEIKVFTSAAPAAVEKALAAKYSETTGNHVVLGIGTVRDIQEKLTGGETPDIVVLPSPALDELERAAKLRPGSRIDLARVGIGVVVREGAPLPDIASVDALRQTLLAAHSIAHPDPQGGGFAGAQIARMFTRLGIAEAIKPKVRLAYAFAGGVTQVASGEAEIGLFNISEILPVKGIALVGPLVPELQSYITFAAALHVAGAPPAAGFLHWLADPQAREAWHMGGFEHLGAGH
jgi:molybdate transport system substrate-binding protein